MRFAGRYRLPLLVTEHGACDGDDPDERRRRFLTESLAGLARAMADGTPGEGYLHWSLLDNFEWAEGFTPRFGIFALDEQTLHRRWTTSAHRYHEIIELSSTSATPWTGRQTPAAGAAYGPSGDGARNPASDGDSSRQPQDDTPMPAGQPRGHPWRHRRAHQVLGRTDKE